jgi:hypothetical protein
LSSQCVNRPAQLFEEFVDSATATPAWLISSLPV